MPTQQTISIDDLEPPIEDTLNSKNDIESSSSPLMSSEPLAKKANDDAGDKDEPVPENEQDSSKPTVTPGNSKRKSPTAAKKQQSARSQMSIESFFNKTPAASSSPAVASKMKTATPQVGLLRTSTVACSNQKKSGTQKKPAPAAAAAAPLKKSNNKPSTDANVKPAAASAVMKPATSASTSVKKMTESMTEEEKKKRQELAAVVMMSASLPLLKQNNDGDKKPAAAAKKSVMSQAVPEEEKVISEPTDEPAKQEDTDTVDEAEPDLANAAGDEEPAAEKDDVVVEAVQADEVTEEAKTTKSKEEDAVMEEAESSVAKKPAEVVDLSLEQKQPAIADNISDEHKTQLENYSSLCSKYTQRATELMERGQEGLAEELFDAMDPSQVATSVEDVAGAGDEFPDEALRTLLVMVQESTLPLSELTATCLSQLEALFPNAAFTSESVSSKIKIVATRDSYIAHPEVAAGQPQSSQAVNVFEDTSGNRMWRWEVTSLDLLPEALVTKVKKARTARRKLRSHFKALCKLIGSLRDADKLIRESSTPQSKLNALSAKISNEEEKVLKYEREEEKLRLADEAKKKKSALIKQKELEKQLKQKAKDEAQEQKRQQQEQKKKEAQAKKLAKEEKAAKEQREKERALKQQRSALMKFIHVGESTTPPRKKSEGGSSDEPVPHKSPCVDSDKFWSKVNSGDREGTSSGPFSSLSVQAKASRKRRSRHVPVLVYVTVEPEENVFNAQDYAEQQTVHVSNRFRFLSFFEDCRPPYHGTWSKKSSVVTGAKPFGKDTDVLDYEVDSEAEWEEGDDDMGEDVESKGDDDEDVDEDARDTRAYDFQDGWMAADDDLGDDEDGDLDDETKMLRKKKMQTSGASDHKQAITEQVAVSIVAPMPGGVPFHSSDSEKVGLDCIEGIEEKQATDMLSLRRGQILEHEPLWLDAFPPALIDEDAPATQKSGSSPNSQEMSRDDLKVFVDFVHHCTYPSKDRVVEELRTTHKNITSSRAQATRKLDAVANKRRNPAGGVIWEVNRDILEDLGMDELLKKKLPEEPKKPATAKKQKQTPSDEKKPAAKKKKGLNGSAAAQNVAAAAFTTKTPAKDGKASSVAKKESAKKRKTPESPSASSKKLFAAFLAKKTKTDEGS